MTDHQEQPWQSDQSPQGQTRAGTASSGTTPPQNAPPDEDVQQSRSDDDTNTS